jgi:hypothetical protein
MIAKLKSGKIISGKLAELFVKKGIAVECDDEAVKAKGRPKKKVKE